MVTKTGLLYSNGQRPDLKLHVSPLLKPKVPTMKIVKFANSIDPDEVAHDEHLIWIYTVCSLVFEYSLDKMFETLLM